MMLMISIESVVKTLLYVALGAVLLVANLWYLRSSYRALTGTQRADIIAPFQIINGPDDAQLGRKLALLLQSRLAQIEYEIEDANALALEPRNQFFSPDLVRPQDQSQQEPVDLPDEVFQSLNIDVNVGELRLGGLFSWVWERLRSDRFIQVTVEFQPDKAIVGLDVGGGSRPQWFNSLPTANEQVVTYLAYAIAQPYFAQNVPETTNLSPAEFQNLLFTLHELARLNRQIASGFPATGEYSALMPNLEALAARLPKWKQLLYIAAQTAENARQHDKALFYYQQVQVLVDSADQTALSPTSTPSSSEEEYLARKIEEISSQLLTAVRVSLPVTRGDVESTRDLIRTLVGVESPEVPDEALRIGIIGPPPPPGVLPQDVMVFKNDRYDDQATQAAQSALATQMGISGEFASQYVPGIIQVTQLTASNVTFMVAGSGLELPSATTADILAAIEKLAVNGADIILVTYGPLQGKIFGAAFESYPNIVFIQSQQKGSATAPVSSNSMMVSSVTLTGTAASFALATDTISLWAPGVEIPIELASGATTVSGNTYAAALATGIVAHLRAYAPEITAEKLITILHETSKPQTVDGPPLLNLNGALEQIRRE